MPKRKGGRKKRGGNGALANAANVHDAARFSSKQGLVSGCAGCVGGNVQIGSLCNLSSQSAAHQSSIRGISRLMNGITGRVGKIQNGGGNVAVTTNADLQAAAQSGMGYGRMPVTSVQNCGVQSSTSMGAGQKGVAQKGGGDNSQTCVSYYNNLGTPGYGLNVPPTNALNSIVQGSGYPIVSPYNTNKCGGRKVENVDVNTVKNVALKEKLIKNVVAQEKGAEVIFLICKKCNKCGNIELDFQKLREVVENV